MSSSIINVSPLNKCWIFDLDGTIVKHNGYLIDGHDTLLDGAAEFFGNIPQEDTVIILTARKEEYREITEKFLADTGIRYDHIIYNMPYGERILINDKKNSGLKTAIAVNTERDRFMNEKFVTDESL